jgi:hypothetical protein
MYFLGRVVTEDRRKAAFNDGSDKTRTRPPAGQSSARDTAATRAADAK